MKKFRLCSFFLSLVLLAGLLLPCAQAAEPPETTGKAVLLVDITYGEDILYQRNAYEKMYPASITKVMTGLLVLEAVERGELSLDQEVTVTENVSRDMFWNASNAGLKVGEVMSLGDMLRCALIPSACDACNVLAEEVSGTIEDFVDLMNQRAAELGCQGTHFANPHGLHNANHYTTAWDIYLICREAMKNSTFREIVSSVNYVVPATNLHAKRELHDTNSLLSNHHRTGYLYKYATGIKTGFTDEAGRCLASSATKDNRSLICVVLGCTRTPGATGSAGFVEFTESKNLLEWGFNSFSRRALLSTTDLLGDMPVTLSKTEHVALQPAAGLEATLPKDVPDSEIIRTVRQSSESIEAPVKKGQVLGSVTVSYNGVDYGTVDLVAVSDVERSDLLYYIDRIQKFFAQTWVQLLLIALAVLVLILVLWSVFFRKRRRYTSRYSRSRGNYRGGRRR